MTRGHRIPVSRVSIEDVSLAALPAAMVSSALAIYYLLDKIDGLPLIPFIFAASVAGINLAILVLAYKRPLLTALGVGLVDLYWYLNSFAFSSPDSPNYFNIIGAIPALLLGETLYQSTMNPYLAAIAATIASATAIAAAGLALRRLARLASRLYR